MISLQEFKDYLTFIRKQRAKEDNFADALNTLSPDCYCNVFIFPEYEDKLIQLLEIILNDTNDNIGYFIYELEGLSFPGFIVEDKDKCPTDNKGNMLYYSADTLYEYLTRYNV